MSKLDKHVEELENKHFDAGFDLQQAALDWAIAHADGLREMAEDGCEHSKRLVAAVDAYFPTWERLDKAETDRTFEEIVNGQEG